MSQSIDHFFASCTPVTRQQCDEFVLSRLGTPAKPVAVQSAWSYTVMAGKDNCRIVQFRAQTSILDPEMVDLAQRTASGLVVEVIFHGIIGDQEDRPLFVYEMDKLPGEVYMTTADHSIIQPEDAKARQRNTITDLASFFAQSWNMQEPILDKTVWITQRARRPITGKDLVIADYRHMLCLLAESLPTRFSEQLPSLEPYISSVCNKLPHAVTHGDLTESNILIDPATGHITGIIDWTEAKVLPFGFALWAVENVLGFIDAEGWHYYDNHDELRGLFWSTFREKARNCTEEDMALVDKARMIGIFCRYGFRQEDGLNLGRVIDETDTSNMAYLDAFCIA